MACINNYINTVSKNKPEKGKVFIYMLVDPRTEQVRYIGKTIQSLSYRYSDHISISKSRAKQNYRQRNWVKQLISLGLLPIIELIDIVDVSEWEEKEIFYIAYFKYIGCNLTNYQKGGGNGNLGRSWKVDENKLKNKKLLLLERDFGFNLFNISGNIIKYYKNIPQASIDLNISPHKLHSYVLKKTLINKNFFLLKKDEIFTENLLKRKYRKISIEKENFYIVFNNQKECSKYLNLPNSTLNLILHGKMKNKTEYKITLI